MTSRPAILVAASHIAARRAQELERSLQYLDWTTTSPDEAGEPLKDEAREQLAREILCSHAALVVIDSSFHLPGDPSRGVSQFRLVSALRSHPDFAAPIVIFGTTPLAMLRSDVTSSCDSHDTAREVAIVLDACCDAAQIIDDCGTTASVAFVRCPKRPTVLRAEIDAAFACFDRDGGTARRLLANQLLAHEAESLARRIRHRHHNVLAALRLLLGAYAAGDIDTTTFEDACKQVSAGESQLVRQYSRVRDELLTVRSASQRDASEQCIQAETRTGRIMIVDDHLEPSTECQAGSTGDFGWLPTYRAILSESRRFGFEIIAHDSYESAMEEIARGSVGQLDLVVLDVDLGDASRSGLHLLGQLRNVAPTVPVLVVSAFDDADICVAALEQQADGYFVKQLDDRRDRASADYYRKFTEAIESVLDQNWEIHCLYRRFHDRLPLILEHDRRCPHIRRPEDGVCGRLTKLLLLLRGAQRHALFHSVLESRSTNDDDDGYDAQAITLQDAVRAWLNWSILIAQAPIQSFGVWLDQHAGGIQGADYQLVRALHRWTPVRHGRVRSVRRREIVRLVHALLDSIPTPQAGVAERAPLSPCQNEDVAEQLTETVLRSRERCARSPADHSVRARMGSEALLLGTYLDHDTLSSSQERTLVELNDCFLSFGPDVSATKIIPVLEQSAIEGGLSLRRAAGNAPDRRLRICLVDDEPSADGWAYVTQLAIPGVEVQRVRFEGPSCSTSEVFEEYIGAILHRPLMHSDVVLLDLKMPRVRGGAPQRRTGLDVLQCLRRWDPLLPVIVLSSSRRARLLRQAIRHGASDFFPKECPGQALREDLVQYQRSLARRFGRLELHDPRWADLLLRCRFAGIKLDESIACLKQGHAVEGEWERGLARLLNEEAVSASWPKWIRSCRNSRELQLRVLQHLRWLLRRAFLSLLLPRDPFLAPLTTSFSAAARLRPQFLSSDELWLSCAMIVEFLYNVADVAGGAGGFLPPGKRAAEGKDKELEQAIGRPAYTLGLQIWKLRNQRRHQGHRNRARQRQDAQDVMADCLDFLQHLGITANPPTTRGSNGRLDALQQNLDQEEELAQGRDRIAVLTRRIGQLASQPRSRDAELLRELEQQRSELAERCGTSQIAELLDDRHGLGRELGLLPEAEDPGA